jgi:hypothetical protein
MPRFNVFKKDYPRHHKLVTVEAATADEAAQRVATLRSLDREEVLAVEVEARVMMACPGLPAGARAVATPEGGLKLEDQPALVCGFRRPVVDRRRQQERLYGRVQEGQDEPLCGACEKLQRATSHLRDAVSFWNRSQARRKSQRAKMEPG